MKCGLSQQKIGIQDGRTRRMAAAWIWMAAALLLLAVGPAGATVFYVSSQGSDENVGTSPDKPWQTLSRVNGRPFVPGDRILFRRGDVWRGQLVPDSGDPGAFVMYGAYGEGEKPLFLGSVEKNSPECWVDEGNNIWATKPPAAGGTELLKNNAYLWHFHSEEAAVGRGAVTSEEGNGVTGYRVECVKPGETSSNMQVYTGQIAVSYGKLYRLEFKAKCSKPFDMPTPRLMQNCPPWAPYGASGNGESVHVDKDWQTYSVYYRSGASAADGRVTFYLGGAMPEGTTFDIDGLSLIECGDNGVLTHDVGNIIFNAEESCGVKVWNEADLDTQGEYWYDEKNHILKLYSAACPATQYSDIECAIRMHIIDQSNRSYVTYEDLAMKYGAAHGIGGGNTHHIVVRNCDFGYIGGGDQGGGDSTVRFGNGIEFWGNANDCLVERCRLWEVYDAALTNQSGGPATKQFNIVYRNNVIWNCEYSFEYWNRPEDSETYNVVFENNTCVNAGYGWGHAQRPDPSGRQLCFYSNPAQTRDLIIRNNIFFEAKTNALYLNTWAEDRIAGLQLDYNCWYQEEGDMVLMNDTKYTMAQFPAYQGEKGKDVHSIAARPAFVDIEKHDFHLAEGSPGIDMGVKVEAEVDFDGNAIPQGAAPDMGAFEFAVK